MPRKKEERSTIAGERLKIAKDIIGKSYEDLIDERWQKIVQVYDPKNIREWTKNGVPLNRIKSIAEYFGIFAYQLSDDKITPLNFMKLIELGQENLKILIIKLPVILMNHL
ncbi:MAG: hypothetical protein OMM_09320 [Candidatus Magnetoglobus multicellularis str. Araruama]|uniref:Uncharacterized protein n=1 Tax=Candidatus Magnetoglobus multicellularis str. Araruama TaxID=890399 RepID=A0A1V1P4L8_9BACT|nr:MAG: hypothetical protein OMM_09320 [Candidatus Magnetoglobus multicellularis str. Araruama]